MKSSSFFRTFLLTLFLLTVSCNNASALSFRLEALDDKSSFFEKFIDSLFQNNIKSGTSLTGDVSHISSTTLLLFSQEKTYLIGISKDTKVRKANIPTTLTEVKEGDKVSVVSAVSTVKGENVKLKAKIIRILSQENEKKEGDKKDGDIKNASSTEIKADSEKIASSTEVGTLKEVKEIKEVKE